MQAHSAAKTIRVFELQVVRWGDGPFEVPFILSKIFFDSIQHFWLLN